MKQLSVLLCIGLTCVFSQASVSEDPNASDSAAATVDPNASDSAAATVDPNALDSAAATEDPNALDSAAATEDPNASHTEDMKEWDRISYVLGMRMGKNLKDQNFNINIELVLLGIRDILMDNKLLFTDEEVDEIWKSYMQWERKRYKQRQEAKKKKEHEQLLKKLGENAWKLQLEKPELMSFDPEKEYFWILETNKGTIKIRLMPEVAPMHVTSTIFLTNKTFYDGLTFHRVISGFMAQGGCPVGNGKYDPGYQYDGEIDPNIVHDRPFLVSMANRGPGTDGSQFFITFKETPNLNGRHTIFGEVVEGQDVVKKLEEAGTRTGKPKESLIINKASIEEKEKQS
jgi:cyclophilin family peptidyl-prolyl cis-trans isomerase